jgi:DNA mismatch repair protein MutS2
MMFDEKTLEPMYKLVWDKLGSSFTFEGWKRNSFSLINRAKEEVGKVRLTKQ